MLYLDQVTHARRVLPRRRRIRESEMSNRIAMLLAIATPYTDEGGHTAARFLGGRGAAAITGQSTHEEP